MLSSSSLLFLSAVAVAVAAVAVYLMVFYQLFSLCNEY
jgi:hypothetical protein